MVLRFDNEAEFEAHIMARKAKRTDNKIEVPIVKKKRNKYNVAAKEDRTWIGMYRGREQTIVFDSKKEMDRFIELLRSQPDGMINELVLQDKFLLPGKIKYIADFTYWDTINLRWVAEDSKGVRTDVYKLKLKLFKETYPDLYFIET